MRARELSVGDISVADIIRRTPITKRKLILRRTDRAQSRCVRVYTRARSGSGKESSASSFGIVMASSWSLHIKTSHGRHEKSIKMSRFSFNLKYHLQLNNFSNLNNLSNLSNLNPNPAIQNLEYYQQLNNFSNLSSNLTIQNGPQT
jgi:hypothetical protein